MEKNKLCRILEIARELIELADDDTKERRKLIDPSVPDNEKMEILQTLDNKSNRRLKLLKEITRIAEE